MIRHVKNFYRRLFSEIGLLGVEILLSIILFIAAFILFVFISRYIFVGQMDTFDNWGFDITTKMVNDQSTSILLFFTALGSSGFLLPANILLVCYFLFIRYHRWYSIKIPAIALSSVIMMHMLKLFFNRPRPPMPLLEAAGGLSFPSGHAMSSVTFYGLLICFVWDSKINLYAKIILIIILVFLIIIIGFSRIYLRVHYPSDVVGGYCAGIIWLLLSLFIIRKIELMSAKKSEQGIKVR